MATVQTVLSKGACLVQGINAVPSHVGLRRCAEAPSARDACVSAASENTARLRRAAVTSCSLSASEPEGSSLSRRAVLSAGAGVGIASLLPGGTPAAFAEALDSNEKYWETIPLPVDKEIVLLDITFPTATHGKIMVVVADILRLVRCSGGPPSGSHPSRSARRGLPRSCMFCGASYSLCPRPRLLPSTGFIVGTRQTLLETVDGGLTWEVRNISGQAQSDDDDDEGGGINYRYNSISFSGKEGWIVGKPAILFHTVDEGKTWERIPLSAKLPGNPVTVYALNDKGGAEMTTDQGALYVTSNAAYTWKAAVEETVSATLNRTVSSGISGASYYTGSFSTINRREDGTYVGISSRGNFYMTWEPGQPFWYPHNRNAARRIQSMGFRRDGGLWLLTRGGGLFFGQGLDVTGDIDFDEVRLGSRGFGVLDLGYRTDSELWAAGGSGTLLVSFDGGKTWKRDKTVDEVAANLYAVRFYNEKLGFILGNNGVLLRYFA
eukprot:jgi/Mesvir1/19113/Mv12856-RA.2